MNPPLKILHIIKSLGRGGAEMLLPETLKLHDKASFEFHYIYFLPWKDQMVGSLELQGGHVTCLSANSNIQLMLKVGDVVRYIKKHNIQLVHAHLPWAGILARGVGRLTGIPVIYTEHNKQERYHVLTRLANLATMPWLARIVAVSRDVAESIRKHKPGLTVPVQTVLNGVNVEHFTPAQSGGSPIRQLLGIPENAPVIGTIAVFRFQKRLDLWMDIAAQILKEVPETHFIIVGDGPLKEKLVARRQALGLEDRIHLAGLQTEVRSYLAVFDIYMMSSVFEGLPIALLEAMASGCPVITTDAGGVKEVIRHEVDGLLCSVDEPHQLKDLASQLLKDKTYRKQLGLEGRKRIEQSFSMKKMVKELEEMYRAIAADKEKGVKGE